MMESVQRLLYSSDASIVNWTFEFLDVQLVRNLNVLKFPSLTLCDRMADISAMKTINQILLSGFSYRSSQTSHAKATWISSDSPVKRCQ